MHVLVPLPLLAGGQQVPQRVPRRPQPEREQQRTSDIAQRRAPGESARNVLERDAGGHHRRQCAHAEREHDGRARHRAGGRSGEWSGERSLPQVYYAAFVCRSRAFWAGCVAIA